MPIHSVAGRLDVVRTVTITGAIKYYQGEIPVPDALIALTGDIEGTTITGEDGRFEVGVEVGRRVKLTPSRATDESPGAGISTLDITILRRHILNIEPLATPYKPIAGDINRSGSLSTLDISLMRRFVLGLETSLPHDLWRFIRSEYRFPNQLQPWTFESTRDLGVITGEVTDVDFVAVKLGDVNGSRVPTSEEEQTSASARSFSPMTMSDDVVSLTLVEQPNGEVHVCAGQFGSVTSLQMTFAHGLATLTTPHGDAAIVRRVYA